MCNCGTVFAHRLRGESNGLELASDDAARKQLEIALAAQHNGVHLDVDLRSLGNAWRNKRQLLFEDALDVACKATRHKRLEYTHNMSSNLLLRFLIAHTKHTVGSQHSGREPRRMDGSPIVATQLTFQSAPLPRDARRVNLKPCQDPSMTANSAPPRRSSSGDVPTLDFGTDAPSQMESFLTKYN